MAPDNSAREPSSNITSSSDVNRHPKWTVMVFMGADTIDGNEPLDDAARADLEEISSIGGAKTLDIFIEVHRATEATRRYHFGFDGDRQTRNEETIPQAGA